MDKLKSMSPASACLIGIVIAGLLFFFVLGGDGSLEKSLKPIRNKKVKLTKDIQEKEKIIKEAFEYQENIKKLGKAINKVIKYIPENMSSAKMMRSLTDSAKVSGVNIIDVSDKGRVRSKPGEAANEVLYDRIPVSIKLEGNFTQIMMFLSNLTKLDNIITVEELSINSNRRIGEGMVAFSAVFVGYRYKGQQ